MLCFAASLRLCSAQPLEAEGSAQEMISTRMYGGTRARSCSAAAYIIELGTLIQGQWVFKPLAMSGTYINSPVSSFNDESLALEESLLFLKRLLTRPGKRPRRG